MVNKNTVTRRKQAGVCIRCGEALAPGHTQYCVAHRDEQRAQNSRAAAKRAERSKLMSAQGSACKLCYADIAYPGESVLREDKNERFLVCNDCQRTLARVRLVDKETAFYEALLSSVEVE